jgi:hypothetical protein
MLGNPLGSSNHRKVPTALRGPKIPFNNIKGVITFSPHELPACVILPP